MQELPRFYIKKNSLAYKYFSESVSYKSPKKIPKS